MTYETTSNLGLVYFDDSVFGRNWAVSDEIEAIAAKNNSVISQYVSQVQTQSYSPTLVTSDGGLSLGNTNIQGAYLELPERWVIGWFRFILGSSFTKGSGDLRVSLPFVPSVFESTLDSGNPQLTARSIIFGEGTYRDNVSVPNSQNFLLRYIQGTSQVSFYLQAYSGRDRQTLFSEDFNLKEGDGISGNFFYRRAVQ